MQTPDELYSTDNNPVNTSQQSYDTGQPEITTPGETEEDPHKIMPIAGANETDTDDDNTTDDEEEIEDNQDIEEGEDDINSDAETPATMSEDFSARYEDDKGGVY